MPKLTNNNKGAGNFVEAPKPGVDFYLSFWKEEKIIDGKRVVASMFNAVTKGTNVMESPGIGPCMWLGHFVRLEGQTEGDPAENLYSTAFENYDDFIEIRKKEAKSQDAKPTLIYTGRANDEAAKKEMKYHIGKSGYTIYLMLISRTGKLFFVKVDGMNTGQYFDFANENPDADFIEIAGLEEKQNPKKKDKMISVLKFAVPAETPTFPDVSGKVDGLRLWLDHVLHYARTGAHKTNEENKPVVENTSSVAPETTDSVDTTGIDFSKRLANKPQSAPVTTEDDDLPF